MFDKSTSRAETTVNVRRALIRHWIDLDLLSITPQRGYVRVTGAIRTQRREVEQQGMSSLLTILEEEIRRCKGVERVQFDLENWKKNSEGDWVPVRSGMAPSAKTCSTVEGTVLVLEEPEGSAARAPGLPKLPPWSPPR